MKGRHLALVVEDDAETAEDLVQILESVDCASIVADNAEDAEKRLEEKSFCLILLDLQIRKTPDSIKGHVEHGKSVLRTIRARYNEHMGNCYSLPVLIVSGFARETDVAVEVMKTGASDIIQKPLVSGQVSERIRQALQDSGRRAHDGCGELPRQRSVSLDNGIVLADSGRQGPAPNARDGWRKPGGGDRRLAANTSEFDTGPQESYSGEQEGHGRLPGSKALRESQISRPNSNWF